MSLTKKLITLSLISVSVIALSSCVRSSDRMRQGTSDPLSSESEEKPTIVEKPEEVAAINPQSSDYLYRADSYNESYEHDKAIDYYTKAIAADPQNAVAYEGRADIYEKLQQYDKAIADLTQSIAIDPYNVSAYDRRAFIYHYYLSEPDKAIADLTKAIALETKYEFNSQGKSGYLMSYEIYTLDSLYELRGRVYLELKQYDKAIADYTKAIAISSEYAPAYKNRGDLYQETGNITQAKQDWIEAASLYQQQDNMEQSQIIQQQLEKL